MNERLTIGFKLDRIKIVCAKLAKAHGLVDTTFHKALVEQIEHANQIIAERNAVIHGKLTVKRGERPIVRSRKQTVTVELNPNALSALVQKIHDASIGLFYRSRELHGCGLQSAGRAALKNRPHFESVLRRITRLPGPGG